MKKLMIVCFAVCCTLGGASAAVYVQCEVCKTSCSGGQCTEKCVKAGPALCEGGE